MFSSFCDFGRGTRLWGKRGVVSGELGKEELAYSLFVANIPHTFSRLFVEYVFYLSIAKAKRFIFRNEVVLKSKNDKTAKTILFFVFIFVHYRFV